MTEVLAGFRRIDPGKADLMLTLAGVEDRQSITVGHANNFAGELGEASQGRNGDQNYRTDQTMRVHIQTLIRIRAYREPSEKERQEEKGTKKSEKRKDFGLRHPYDRRCKANRPNQST